VVGIAVSQIGGGQNLNFAIPINYARGLLGHVGEEPLTVLRPTTMAAGQPEATPVVRTNSANSGLSYTLQGFGGYRVETEMVLEGTRRQRTRVTYRLIEAVSASEPRIERSRESETTEIVQPFGTVQVLRRERSRVLVGASDLRPIFARGETTYWSGTEWATAEHDLRFENSRVIGLVTDTAGNTVELDRELPTGILLQDVRDLAFALLEADSLVRRSVEFTTFDPTTGRVDRERYDVMGERSVEVAGESYEALTVNVATGLDNETYIVKADRPRIFLERVSDDGTEVERVTALEIQPARAGPTTTR
jgi:hypothetical protein